MKKPQAWRTASLPLVALMLLGIAAPTCTQAAADQI